MTCQTDKQIADTLLIAADGLTNATPLEFLLPLLKFFLLLFGYEMPIHSSFAMAKESGNGKKIHLFIHPFKIFLKIKNLEVCQFMCLMRQVEKSLFSIRGHRYIIK